MTPEPEQNSPGAAGSKATGSKATGSKPRTGVPIWRTGKPDAVLAEAVDIARDAVEGIAPAGQVGRHLGAKSEGDRLATHLFESTLPGYLGWQWYAVLTRNSRSKVITVDELGLLPSQDSILAPEWVPWAERVRPGDEQDEEAPAGAVAPESRDQAVEEPGATAGSEEDDPDVVASDETASDDGAAPEDDYDADHDDASDEESDKASGDEASDEVD